jgi:hypothetical protein
MKIHTTCLYVGGLVVVPQGWEPVGDAAEARVGSEKGDDEVVAVVEAVLDEAARWRGEDPQEAAKVTATKEMSSTRARRNGCTAEGEYRRLSGRH